MDENQQQQQPPPQVVKEEGEEEIVFVGEFDNGTSIHYRNLNQILIEMEDASKVKRGVLENLSRIESEHCTTFLDKFRKEMKSLTTDYDKAISELKDEKEQIEMQVNELKGNINELKQTSEAMKELVDEKNNKVTDLEKALEELKKDKGQVESNLNVTKQITVAQATQIADLKKSLKEIEKQKQDLEQRANAELNSTPLPDSRNKRTYDDMDLNDSAYETQNSSQYSSRSSSSPTLSPQKTNSSIHKKTKFQSQAGSSRSSSFNTSAKETTSVRPPKSIQEQADKILNDFDDEENVDISLARQMIDYLAILWFNKNKNTSSSPVTKKLIQHCLRTEKVDPSISLLQKRNLITCDLKKRPVIIEMSSLRKQIWQYWSVQVLKNENELEQILNHVLSHSSESKLKDLNTSRGSALSFKGVLKLVVNLSSTLDKEKNRQVIGLKKQIGCYLKSNDKETDTAFEVLESCFKDLTEVYDDEEDEDSKDELNLEITLVRREMAELYKRKGEFDKALEIYEQVCPAFKEKYGPTSDKTKNVHVEYLEVLTDLDKIPEAVDIFRDYGKYMKDYRYYGNKFCSTGESKYKKEERK